MQTIHIPGHTAGMLGLLVEGNIFTGDTLFKNSVGGVRAPGSTSYSDLKSSIMDVLMALPPETVIPPVAAILAGRGRGITASDARSPSTRTSCRRAACRPGRSMST